MSQTTLVLSTSVITVDKRLQMRVALNQEHVDDIAEALAEGKTLDGPLPIVFQTPSHFWLADGFHRLAAHVKARVAVIKCEIRLGDFRDALRDAVRAPISTPP